MATLKGPSHRMQGLLGEFRKLYEGRLAKLKSKKKNDKPAGDIVSNDSVVVESIQNYEVIKTDSNCSCLILKYLLLID